MGRLGGRRELCGRFEQWLTELFVYSQCVNNTVILMCILCTVYIAVAAMFAHRCVCTGMYITYACALVYSFSCCVPVQRRKGKIATKSAKLVKKLNEQVCGSRGSVVTCV